MLEYPSADFTQKIVVKHHCLPQAYTKRIECSKDILEPTIQFPTHIPTFSSQTLIVNFQLILIHLYMTLEYDTHLFGKFSTFSFLLERCSKNTIDLKQSNDINTLYTV